MWASRYAVEKDVLKAACRVCVWYSSSLIRLDELRSNDSLFASVCLHASSALLALTLYEKL